MKSMRTILNDLTPTPTTPGELIRSVRHNFGITQDALAEVTGLQRSNLSSLENDKLEMTVHYAEILGAALGLHPATILFPNGYQKKSTEIIEIEKRARKKFGPAFAKGS